MSLGICVLGNKMQENIARLKCDLASSKAPEDVTRPSLTYRSTRALPPSSYPYSLNRRIHISIERPEIHSGMKPPSAFGS
jgi:hypothetical protein